MRRKFATAALLLTTITCSGCASAVGPAVKFGTAGLSAAGAYFSYKALQQDPVEVTTLSRDCTFLRYIRVSCEQRAAIRAMPDGETWLKQISDQNAWAVQNCPNVQHPGPLTCP